MSNERLEELRIDIKGKMLEIADLTEDRYCDGCFHSRVEAPFRGPRGADINPWRDEYKCYCNYLNTITLNGRKEKIPKALQCLIFDYKEKIGE